MKLMVFPHLKKLMVVGNMSRKGMDGVVKLAIKECSKERGVIKSKVTTHNILDYLMDNNYGKLWATLHRIRIVRNTLPKTYQKK